MLCTLSGPCLLEQSRGSERWGGQTPRHRGAGGSSCQPRGGGPSVTPEGLRGEIRGFLIKHFKDIPTAHQQSFLTILPYILAPWPSEEALLPSGTSSRPGPEL